MLVLDVGMEQAYTCCARKRLYASTSGLVKFFLHTVTVRSSRDYSIENKLLNPINARLTDTLKEINKAKQKTHARMHKGYTEMGEGRRVERRAGPTL